MTSIDELAPAFCYVETIPPRPAYLQGHQKSLDILRGIAIIMVLLYHFISLGAARGFAGRLMESLTRSSWCGVDLFLVLSGYLITGILIDSKEAPNYFRRFYRRRCLRIFPIYYFVVTLGFVLCVMNLVPKTLGLPTSPSSYIPLFLYYTNFATAFYGAGFFGAFAAFWSLAVEEHFYFVWPLLVRSVQLSGLVWVCVGVIACASLARIAAWNLGVLPVGIYENTFCRMDTLAMGGLTATLLRMFPRGARLIRVIAGSAMAVSLVILCVIAHGSGEPGLSSTNRNVQIFGFPFISTLMAAILVLAVTARPTGLVNRFVGNGILRWYGKYSYGIYILHGPILFWANGHLDARTIGARLGSRTLGFVIRPAVGLLASSVAGWLSWNLLERHFLKFK